MAPKITGAVVAVVATILATAPARAQVPVSTPSSAAYPVCTKPPSKSEVDGAHYAYLAGRHSFDEGDYPTAITYFRDAYRRDCTKHELLPIIARAYELSQNRADALLALETFVKRVPPNDPNVDPVKKRIANLKAQGDAKASPAPGPATAPPSSPAVTPAATPSTATTPAAAPPSPSPSEAPSSSRSRSVVPWVVAGAGVVAATVGAVFVIGGSNKRSDATALCPTSSTKGRTCPTNVDSNQVQSDYDGGTSQMTTGFIVGGVGVAALAGGIVWLLVDRGGTATSASTVSPWVTGTGQGAGVALTRSF